MKTLFLAGALALALTAPAYGQTLIAAAPDSARDSTGVAVPVGAIAG